MFSGNQALQLLWIHEKEEHIYNLGLSKDELATLRADLFFGWDDLTTPYKDNLEVHSLVEVHRRLTKGQPIFK